MKAKKTTTRAQATESDIPAIWQAGSEGDQKAITVAAGQEVAQAPVAAPAELKATTKATRAKKAAPKATKPATKATTKPAKTKKAATKKNAAPRQGSKKDMILALISSKTGASLEEIMKATGWQKHSVRGSIATMGKTIKIESFKSDAGARSYRAS